MAWFIWNVYVSHCLISGIVNGNFWYVYVLGEACKQNQKQKQQKQKARTTKTQIRRLSRRMKEDSVKSDKI